MIRSKLFQFILGSVFGAAIIVGIVGTHERHAMAAAAEPQKPCASVMGQTVTQEGWDFAQQAIRTQHATIERLTDDLAKARQNAASWQEAFQVENGNLGHAAQVLKDCAQGGTTVTVLYESGRVSLNVSLLPLAGAPRVAIGPNSELQPRWVVPGRIQPQMIGETRKAIYYYFDSTSSHWQGPFAPERVAQ